MSAAGAVLGDREQGDVRIEAAGARAGHVLLLFQPEVGGVPRYVADLAEGLAQRGWAVSAAAPSHSAVHDRLRAVARHVVAFDTPRRPAPLADLRLSRELVALCRTAGVDVIHAHSSKAGAIAALVGWLARIPSVYSPHAWSFQRDLPSAATHGYVAMERILARRHARVIAVADAERLEAERRRVPRPGQIELIHTGIPDRVLPARETARAELQIDADAFAIGWVGRMSPQKRPEHVPILARELAGDATFVTVGYGNPGADGIRSADPDAAYAASDALVLTSRWEAFPLVVLEAMRAALPVVAYDIGGVREQVVDGVTGFLVESGDVDSMAARLRKLAGNPELALRMGAAGRRRMLGQFNFEEMLGSIEASYRKLLGIGGALTMSTLRLVMVTNNALEDKVGGHERYVRELSSTLSQRGIDVTIVAKRWRAESPGRERCPDGVTIDRYEVPAKSNPLYALAYPVSVSRGSGLVPDVVHRAR